MILPRPRAYIDWTVPADEFGNDVGLCTDGNSYEEYLSWLAGYLYATAIPLPESQRELLAEYQSKGVDYAILDLSQELAGGIWHVEVVQSILAAGEGFSELEASQEQAWNELPEAAKVEWDKEDFFTSEKDFARVCEELGDAQEVPAHIRHTDIPYRPVLAALFKDIPDPKKRYEVLDRFYRNFSECASK